MHAGDGGQRDPASATSVASRTSARAGVVHRRPATGMSRPVLTAACHRCRGRRHRRAAGRAAMARSTSPSGAGSRTGSSVALSRRPGEPGPCPVWRPSTWTTVSDRTGGAAGCRRSSADVVWPRRPPARRRRCVASRSSMVRRLALRSASMTPGARAGLAVGGADAEAGVGAVGGHEPDQVVAGAVGHDDAGRRRHRASNDSRRGRPGGRRAGRWSAPARAAPAGAPAARRGGRSTASGPAAGRRRPRTGRRA